MTTRISDRVRTAETSQRAPLQATMVFLLLGVLLPLSVTHQPVASGSTALILSLMITTYGAAKFAQLVFLGEPRVLSLGFLLFVYPFMGLAPLAQTTAGRYPLAEYSYQSEIIVAVLALIVFSLAAFELGALLARTIQPKRAKKPPLVFSQTALILMGFAGLGLVAWAVASYGFAPYFTSREDATGALSGLDGPGGAYALQDKTGYLLRVNLTRVPVFIALLGTLTSIRTGAWRFGVLGRPASYLFVALLIAANLVVNNPFSNSRFWFGTVFLAIIAVYLPWRTPRGFRILSYLGLAAFVFFFAVLDVFRRSGERDFSLSGPGESMITDGSYSAFQTTLNGYIFAAANPTTNGEQFLTALFTFVPRSMWPGKSVDTGALVDTTYNRAATLWTEFQVDFGTIGVIVGFLLLGIIVTAIDLRVAYAGAAMAVVAVLAAGVMILILRGSLVTAMGAIYPLGVFVFLAFALFPFRHQEQANAALQANAEIVRP